jgi:hypothetical protein
MHKYAEARQVATVALNVTQNSQLVWRIQQRLAEYREKEKTRQP